MKIVLKSLKFCLGASILLLTACGDGIDPELEAATKDREANLSFHVVNDASEDWAQLQKALGEGKTPAGTVLRPYPNFDTYLIINETTRINQDCIANAATGVHPENGRPILNFRFNDHCTEIFGRLTAENVGKRFAVVSDNVILTAPAIRMPITGGSGFIEGGFETMQDVQEFAYILNRHGRKMRQLEQQQQDE